MRVEWIVCELLVCLGRVCVCVFVCACVCSSVPLRKNQPLQLSLSSQICQPPVYMRVCACACANECVCACAATRCTALAHECGGVMCVLPSHGITHNLGIYIFVLHL